MKKERIRRLLIRDIIIAAILAVYGSIVSLTHWSIPCIVYQLTGLQCLKSNRYNRSKILQMDTMDIYTII